MNKSFGPWSTAINTGALQQLDTFWKTRLAMLPSLSRTTPGVARRTLILVAGLAAAALALPTIKWATQAQSAGAAGAVAGELAQRKDTGKGTVVDRRDAPGTEPKGRDTSADVEYLPRPTRFEEKVEAALEKPMEIEFLELPLEDCLTYFQETADIPMWLDKQTLRDEGVALDQPITLKLRAARLESLLNLILKPMQLAYFPENDVLVITTATKAVDNLITRTYPVRDLYQGRTDSEAGRTVQRVEKAAARGGMGGGFFDVESRPLNVPPEVNGVIRQSGEAGFGVETGIQLAQGFGGGGMQADMAAPRIRYSDLVDAITNTIEPDSWDDVSGPGTLTYLKETGCLVIRQTRAVHRQILQLLRDLREAKRRQPRGAVLLPSGDQKA